MQHDEIVLTEIGAKPLPEETQLLLVVRSHARRAFLRVLRQGAAACCRWTTSRSSVCRASSTSMCPALENDFYDLSRKLHPDLYARAGAKEQEWSLEQSSLLNDAYRTLRDPIKRTEYLSETRRRGARRAVARSATEQARASGEVKKQIVPPDLA